MNIKLLIEHYLEFLSLKGGCTESSEFTLVKMPHCWKSRVMAQLYQQVQTHIHLTPDTDTRSVDIIQLLTYVEVDMECY